MSIAVADNFSYQGTKPLDARFQFNTVASMKAAVENTLYDGCFAYVTATKKYYSFDSSNTVDTDTGKWREYSGGGGSSYTAGDGIVIDNDEISTDSMQSGDIADVTYPLPSPGPGVTSLGGLTDVSISDPQENETLLYNPTTQKWENGEGGKTYTAGDGINIDANDEISTDSMQSGDMEEVVETLPGIASKYHKYSTGEQIVGEWINGETIYERVFTITSTVSLQTNEWTRTGISKGDIVKLIDSRVFVDGKHVSYISVGFSSSYTDLILLSTRQTTVSTNDYVLILQYTKS